MQAKNGIHTIFKVIMAGFVAFLILNAMCLVYYNIPGHFSSSSGATDYVYPKYAYYSHMTEGFGYGRMNNEGLNNLENFNSQQIDILLMGSSHVEGTNVSQTETMAAKLNSMFDKSKYVYNLGFSTHDFLRNANNLEAAVKAYRPKEYVIFEFNGISVQELKDVVDYKMKKLPSFDSGIASYLQRMPYLRLGYRQVKFFTGLHVVDMLKIFERKNTGSGNVANIFDEKEYSEMLDLLMNRIGQISADNGLKLIIFRHPQLILNKDSSVSPSTDNEYLEIFKKSCSENNIYFVDMTDIFIDEYKTNYILPHGFSNTAVGTGHLNKNGHKMIANELFKQINKIAGGGSI
jgi:hypothetical protein